MNNAIIIEPIPSVLHRGLVVFQPAVKTADEGVAHGDEKNMTHKVLKQHI